MGEISAISTIKDANPGPNLLLPAERPGHRLQARPRILGYLNDGREPGA